MNAESKLKAGGLSASLVKALSEIEGAAKDKVNPHFKSKYADIASVIDAIKPVLARHDLGFTQHCHPDENGVSVETVLHHAGGDTLSMGTLYVPANKRDPQGFGSALTYTRRYALMTAFGVPAEDDDGNAASKSANFQTGEVPPQKRAKLEGTYPSPTSLKGAIKAFVSTMSAMTDAAEFDAFMATDDVIQLEKQANRDLPEWWETGEGMPPEFEPVASRIARKRRELEEVETIRNRERTPIDAG